VEDIDAVVFTVLFLSIVLEAVVLLNPSESVHSVSSNRLEAVEVTVSVGISMEFGRQGRCFIRSLPRFLRSRPVQGREQLK
jgi:hypothetical protein